MSTTPDLDVRNALITGVSYCTSSTCFYGKVRATDTGANIPNKAVFCLASGGDPPIAMQASATELEASSVQVMVRSNEREFRLGQELARQCLAALHHQNITGYIDVYAEQSEPLYLGEDEDGQHLWSINVVLLQER